MCQRLAVNERCISLLGWELELRILLRQHGCGYFAKDVEVFVEELRAECIPSFVSRYELPVVLILRKGSVRPCCDVTDLRDPLPVGFSRKCLHCDSVGLGTVDPRSDELSDRQFCSGGCFGPPWEQRQVL